MNATHSDSLDTADNPRIIAAPIPEPDRLQFLPRHFGRHFMQRR
jgi:hypothetical protein